MQDGTSLLIMQEGLLSPSLLQEFALTYLLLISLSLPGFKVALLSLCLHGVCVYADSEFVPK